MSKLHAGAADPEYQRITLKAASGAVFDLTDVVGVEGTVYKPSGATAEWTFVISSGATPAALVVTRVFDINGLDVSVVGEYQLTLRLDFGGGVVRRVPPIRFTVTAYP